MTPDGSRFIVGNNYGHVLIGEFATGQTLYSFDAHDGWVTSVSISADGQRAVSGGHRWKKGLSGVSRVAKALVTLNLPGLRGKGFQVRISADGGTAISAWGIGSKVLNIWNTETGETLGRIKTDKPIMAAELIAKGNRAALAHKDSLSVWDLSGV